MISIMSSSTLSPSVSFLESCMPRLRDSPTGIYRINFGPSRTSDILDTTATKPLTYLANTSHTLLHNGVQRVRARCSKIHGKATAGLTRTTEEVPPPVTS